MIINTGCRTDIPAFYSKWFINRIREGYVLVRNPYYPSQITKYLLNPEVVDCIEFCTKNPEPILKYLDELDKFKQDWFVTITPYGKEIEPNVPDKEKVIESFKKLSDHFKRNYYCYANENKVAVKQNMKEHIETSPLLIGEITDNDKITEAKQKSWIISENNQITFI